MRFNNFLIFFIAVFFGVIIFLTNTTSKDISSSSNQYIFYNNGNNESLEKYKGKYTILAFTFTRCPSICPMINLELAKLSYKFKDNINIVSINVDPDYDTDELLLNYMSSNQYDWDVLKGEVSEIERLMKNKLYSNRKLSSPADHLPNLYLMDKNFNYINKYFPEGSETDQLINKLYSLLSE
ncbi:MAG: SCO family protein [Pelagibacteraceae bacterium TMED124]|nr:hypothetical protein [Candidatus Neomarinimicrobiota bacterium]RPG18577.1 MAG: SCO family protein [Pelagibacteraceae bacterium TMED124]